MYALAMEKGFSVPKSTFTVLSNEELLFVEGGLTPANLIFGIVQVVAGVAMVSNGVVSVAKGIAAAPVTGGASLGTAGLGALQVVSGLAAIDSGLQRATGQGLF